MKLDCLLLTLTLLAGSLPLGARAEVILPATQPEIRRGVEMGGTSEERAGRYYDRLIARIEPSGKGEAARLPVYLEFFHREFIEDRRQFATSIDAMSEDGKVVLRGHSEYEEHPAALIGLLQRLGFEAVDQVERLPSSALGDSTFAIVSAEQAFIYDKPTTPRENLTQCVRGDRLFLLKPAENNHLLCHGPDGYVGYIDAGVIERVPAEEFDAPADWTASDGRVEQAIERAKGFLGTKYVWGGTTEEGIDCSGLVYRSFNDQGLALPRDSDQQSLVGRLVATRWHRAGLRRGDLLYFISRRGTINHTAIYLGEGKLLEASGDRVKISSFNKDDPEYSERRDLSFSFAKRLFE